MEALIGQSVPRREDLRFLRGSGRYVADLRPEGVLQVAIVRSTVPAGRITAIDTAAAARSPGVRAVLTGAEVAGDIGPLPELTTPDPRFAAAFSLRSNPAQVPCIAHDQVRYVGEPVAVVVATDRYLAEDAAELVQVSYEEFEPVLEPDLALRPEARPVNPASTGNVGLSLQYTKGRMDPLPSGHVVIERTYRIGRHSGIPLEGRGVLARPTEDGVEVWTSTQIPFLVRRAICEATGWPFEDVRVRTPDVGGGFGPKANVYGEEILVPLLARRLGAPVQWIEDRYEHLTSAAQSRDQVHNTRLVVDADGHILSFEDDFIVDVGAHNLWMSGVVANTAIHVLGAYRTPVCRVSGQAVYTNKTPTAQYRGAGRPEATFALERSLDAAARALGISRIKLRELNVLGPSELPYAQGIVYRDGVDIVLDGGDYSAVLQACQDLVPDQELSELRDREQRAGRLVGTGVATFIEATGRGPFEDASVRLDPDGSIVVQVGTASAGMAHETTLAQVAATALQRPLEAITVRSGDTDGVPDALGTFASRTAVVAGSAVHEAATQLAATACERVAADRDLDPDRIVLTASGLLLPDDTTVSWEDLAASLDGAKETFPLVAIHRFEPQTVTWTMGAHLAVVSVDPTTGMVRVLRYAAVDEGGRSINPAVVEGQVRGGIAQGIGGALLEEFRYETTGQPASTTFATYLLPGTGEVPNIDLAHLEVPSDGNPLGVKGVGESGTIPGCAVLAAAVEDALQDLGIEVTATPIRPSDIRTWLREHGR